MTGRIRRADGHRREDPEGELTEFDRWWRRRHDGCGAAAGRSWAPRALPNPSGHRTNVWQGVRELKAVYVEFRVEKAGMFTPGGASSFGERSCHRSEGFPRQSK